MYCKYINVDIVQWREQNEYEIEEALADASFDWSSYTSMSTSQHKR